MKSDYDRVGDIDKWKNRLLYVSTFITILLTVDGKYKFSETYSDYKEYIELIIGVNSIFVFIYLWLDVRGNLIYSKAERNRTLQYVDNSFDTNFAGKKIDNYFTQDKLNPGFYKFSVNCFENTFHTFHITKKMQVSVYTKAVIILSIFMFSATVGEKGIARYLTEAILPLALVQNAVKLSIFVSRLENLLEVFTSFFTSLKSSNFSNREQEALKNVITYETLLSCASIPLDSEIFKQSRDQLAQEWEILKTEYQIK